MFKMKKLVAAVTIAIIAVSAMTVSVSVSALVNTKENWSIKPVSTNQSLYDGGNVFGLVQGKNSGITFHCTYYYNPTANNFYARGTITQSNLCLYQGDGVNLSYEGDYGTVLFKDNWYSNCYGVVPYRVDAKEYIANSGQYIEGYAN
ncbi:MAG: hypothetical protein NC485_14655 [Ruminococcus flavefaciens]|nr:hypothetical protein [Ruminococcus flavefaciens]MCM1061843.1 hypothetical protein [Eubacterium sp.]